MAHYYRSTIFFFLKIHFLLQVLYKGRILWEFLYRPKLSFILIHTTIYLIHKPISLLWVKMLLLLLLRARRAQGTSPNFEPLSIFKHIQRIAMILPLTFKSMHPSSSRAFPKTPRTHESGSHNYKTKQNKQPSFIDRWSFHWFPGRHGPGLFKSVRIFQEILIVTAVGVKKKW